MTREAFATLLQFFSTQTAARGLLHPIMRPLHGD